MKGTPSNMCRMVSWHILLSSQTSLKSQSYKTFRDWSAWSFFKVQPPSITSSVKMASLSVSVNAEYVFIGSCLWCRQAPAQRGRGSTCAGGRQVKPLTCFSPTPEEQTQTEVVLRPQPLSCAQTHRRTEEVYPRWCTKLSLSSYKMRHPDM